MCRWEAEEDLVAVGAGEPSGPEGTTVIDGVPEARSSIPRRRCPWIFSGSGFGVSAARLTEAWRDPERGLLISLTKVAGWRHPDVAHSKIWLELSTAQPRSGLVDPGNRGPPGTAAPAEPAAGERRLHRRRTLATDRRQGPGSARGRIHPNGST